MNEPRSTWRGAAYQRRDQIAEALRSGAVLVTDECIERWPDLGDQATVKAHIAGTIGRTVTVSRVTRRLGWMYATN